MSVPSVIRAARLLLPAVPIAISIAIILVATIIEGQAFTSVEEWNNKKHKIVSPPSRTRRNFAPRSYSFHRHGSCPNSCWLPIDSFSSTTATATFLQGRRRTPTFLHLQGYEADLMPSIATPFTITIVALTIGVAAQTFINKMLEGDQGLGAFLSDGTGFNKSGYRPSSSSKGNNSRSTVDKDPLPWLKLPQLDFVEVAGQPPPPPKGLQFSENKKKKIRTEKNQIEITGMNIPTIDSIPSTSTDPSTAATGVYEELEQLRIRLVREVQEENVKEATKLQKLLEQRMKEEGIQFTTTGSSSSSLSQSSPPSSFSDRLMIDDGDEDDGKAAIDNGIDFQ